MDIKNHAHSSGISRREFIKFTSIAGGTMLMGMHGGLTMGGIKMSQVSFVHTEDRKKGVVQSIDALRINPVNNSDVLIKPNFNTAGSAPGSTHNDTLVALEKNMGYGRQVHQPGERSYPPTKKVMAEKQVVPLLNKLDVKIIDFDELKEDWIKVDAPESHWKNGFR